MEATTIQPDAAATTNNALLPLDQPRVIAIRDGGHLYTFTFGRITQTDWERYFAGILVTSKNEGRSQVNVIDMNTAGLELFESRLEKVEGYNRELKKEDFWKVKPAHSNGVAWLLRQVSVDTEEGEAPFDPECIQVKLNALWSQQDPASTTLYKGLVHRFAPPTPEQKKRVYRAGAMSKLVGGSRNGLTVQASRHSVLLTLYDQLIQSVEGYSVGGKPLVSPEEVRREMDGMHKYTAALELFIGSSAPEPAAEAEAEAA